MLIRAIAAGVMLFSATASAQEFKRTIIQRSDVPTDTQYESVMGMAEVPPGVSPGRHTHPGVEMLVVLEGEVDFMFEDQAPKHMKAGDSQLIPVGKAHDAKNVGAGTAKIMSTWVIQKGKPLATPAPLAK